MRFTIEEIHPEKEEELIVRCYDRKSDWVNYVKRVENLTDGLSGSKDGKLHRVKMKDIFYFEVVDNKSFVYCKQDVYEVKMKLYEFEEKSRGSMFFRASKSVVLNADKIDYISPFLSGRFEAVLLNGEKVIVSRQYVSDLKHKLGM